MVNSQKEKVEDPENEKLCLNDLNIYDPNFVRAENIEEYFSKGKILPENLVSSRSKERTMFCSNLEAFYQGFVDTAKFLNVSELFKACEFDPFWSRIYFKNTKKVSGRR